MRMYTENIKNTNFLMDKRQNNKKTLTCMGKKKKIDVDTHCVVCIPKLKSIVKQIPNKNITAIDSI